MTRGLSVVPVRDPFFSLVVATVGDNGDLGRLLASLVAQEFRAFEVIVVDQNEDARLDPVLAEYAQFLHIIRIRCARGLSKARNRGLQEARAPIVGFPDDDCWYEPDFLGRVANALQEKPDCMGVTGLCLDETGRPAAGGGSRRSAALTKRNVWGRGVSTTIFLRRSFVDRIGGFDEGLGLGAETPYQSAEETDLLLRLIADGNRIIYRPDLVVRHPRARTEGQQAVEKARRYGLGMGRVLRSHAYAGVEVLTHLARPGIGAIVAFFTRRPDLARLRWTRATGRLRGYVAPPDNVTPLRPAVYQAGCSTRGAYEDDAVARAEPPTPAAASPRKA
jgi:glycosyltransferase involved in cell wall biosynthesis